jgi:hypothetical protein
MFHDMQVSEVDDKGRTLRTYGEDTAAAATATGGIDLSPFVRFSVDHFGNRLLLQDALIAIPDSTGQEAAICDNARQ